MHQDLSARVGIVGSLSKAIGAVLLPLWKKNRGLDRLLEAELSAVVVLCVAGNAIDTAASMGTLTTLEVGMQLYNFAQVLVQRGVQQVVVYQVVRRKSWCLS